MAEKEKGGQPPLILDPDWQKIADILGQNTIGGGFVVISPQTTEKSIYPEEEGAKKPS